MGTGQREPLAAEEEAAWIRNAASVAGHEREEAVETTGRCEKRKL